MPIEETVVVIDSSSTLKSPTLNSLNSQNSLNALSAPTLEPPPPESLPFRTIISIKLRITINVSKRLNLSFTKLTMSMATILKNNSKAKTIVNTRLHRLRTNSYVSSGYGYRSRARHTVFATMISITNVLSAGLIAI